MGDCLVSWWKDDYILVAVFNESGWQLLLNVIAIAFGICYSLVDELLKHLWSLVTIL
jgi:predicted permease